MRGYVTVSDICCAQCGLYRSGTLWAHSTLPVDCHPDVVTMAKPLANGYPIGAVLIRDAVAEPMTVGEYIHAPHRWGTSSEY